MPDPAVLEALEAEGLVRREGGRLRTTRRWQAAVARAALRLYRDGAPWQDLRLPIASAFVELCPDRTDAEIAARVDAMLPIEAAELAPAATAVGLRPSPAPSPEGG